MAESTSPPITKYMLLRHQSEGLRLRRRLLSCYGYSDGYSQADAYCQAVRDTEAASDAGAASWSGTSC